MRNLVTIVGLTLHEAMRRRILVAALICGAGFLALFGIGMHFIVREVDSHGRMTLLERRVTLNILILAGLYVAHFLTIMAAVLLPVDTLSGEITSGVMQTLASKPIRRSDILLGKWIGHGIVLLGYALLLTGGLLVVARVLAGMVPPRIHLGVPLLLLEGILLLTISIAGGARLSTITNGMLAFGLFGIAFIGSWVEQIGTLADNAAARYVGTVASLLMPGEALWQRAASEMQPRLLRELGASPFSTLSVPSVAMVWWTFGYIAVAIGIGLLTFRKRIL